MRDGKSGMETKRPRSGGQRKSDPAPLREIPDQWNPQQEAKDVRRSAQERAELWKTVKSEH